MNGEGKRPRLDQRRAPIHEALETFRKMRVVPFDVPGHKRGRGNPELTAFLGEQCVGVDVNSMKPLDNLCHPVSVIREAEELAAEAFGAAHAFLMVGGTTSSVQSMVLTACKRGDEIILPRNVHRSVLNALVLCGAVPVYVNPEVDTRLGISLGMKREQVAKAIAEHPNAVAVLVNNPTYYGICSDLRAIVRMAHDAGIVFNSPAQLAKFGPMAKAAGKSVGLRINPECSTQDGHAIYDPCAPGSRLGTTRAGWEAALAENPALPELLDGLHFHTLCEQDADALATTLDAVAEKFGDILPRMQWINFGGGHHITRPSYDMQTLERCIRRAQTEWGVTVYLEPGEACALNAGYLLTRVLDVVQNGGTTVAVLDTSAACHMPDVLEMSYRPPLLAAGEPDKHPCTVRLAGDVIGDYSFAAAPAVGDLLVFGDMAIYTTCTV